MCGIYGYIQSKSNKKPLETCLDGLQKLQYRGYDSAGVASIHKGTVLSFKTVGKVDLLSALVKDHKYELNTAIAHTRWATHGGLSAENTHPQIDYKKSIALVHNGIIENYLELKEFLLSKGVAFTSETDTEVITNLIAYLYKGDLKKAIAEAFKRVQGSFAIVLIHKDSPETIFAGARGCPLAVGICDTSKDVYISSDTSSFSESSYSTYFMKNDEIAEITSTALTIYASDGKVKKNDLSTIIISKDEASKDGYDHYMHKEIHEQSSLSARILKKRMLLNTFSFKELENDNTFIEQMEHIDVIACGSSYHAGLIAKEFLEEMTLTPVTIHLASEYRYAKHLEKKNTVAIIISQSGETADTLAAFRCKKESFLLSIALCNNDTSTLTRETHRFIPLMAKKEVSVCSTKAFTSQLLNLYLLGIHFSNVLKIENKSYIEELSNIPLAIDDVLSKEEIIKKYAETYACYPYFFFTGRGNMYPVSMEAALKLKEISYLPAEALPAGEMKHGPIALIDENLATIAFLGTEKTAPKTLSNLSEIKARDGKVLIFGGDTHPEITQDVIAMYKNGNDTFASIPYCIAGQIFSYFIAKKLGKEIDFPRNLAKSVTVE
ncbi:MAG: Glutamine--fructose-6-phosphate aminotransferase [isomerizing] [Chlamydiia bacterium]|nr:Glutamine--fructose-6-phosphate aminotransferase [isomerizing] [Chlamydiia bacterium]MCH9618361.1 Glutamine--fructose-6-phosphate aminotransferase [isomerizing] [Chlamydiia bacterium]MCH9624217.1 Glutamine--fructose-6-phosphate aminotransferase [isomerizing] [Chlamydiia bacterium]